MRVAVVVPAYKVANQILDLIARVGPEVHAIYVVDDACPEESGSIVESGCADPRVAVIRRAENGGVGAAVKTGWRAALADGHEIIVKIDGDGQMDPRLLPVFIEPIAAGLADYTKGNRFFDPENVRRMPRTRLLGNAALSFMSKASSGYWHVFDPTNGYTAISATALRLLPLDKLADRFFFESDVLFRLGTIRAVVRDIPMVAVYQDEPSSLNVYNVVGPFLLGNMRAFMKRIVYNHYLRNFSVASIELLMALPLILFGLVYGISTWVGASSQGLSATSGQVMIAALPILVGVQLLLAFLQFDITSTPSEPLTPTLNAGPLPGESVGSEDADVGRENPLGR